jgi:hypothetical protein
VHSGAKRSASEALALVNSGHEALGAAGLDPPKKKQRNINSNIKQLLPPLAPHACVKRSASVALAVADLEPRNKKHKSKGNQMLAPFAQQQQQQQQAVGSVNNGSTSKTSLWAFVDTALNEPRSTRVQKHKQQVYTN